MRNLCVEIDLIHKGIKTARKVARIASRMAGVEIDLIHKGIKTPACLLLVHELSFQ